MNIDHDKLYNALVSRDSRFDGHFFVGVTTTGIYCRPVCRVRTPKPQNTRFYATAALAEKAGFRPCMKCRPELAPGLSSADSVKSLAESTRVLIDQGWLDQTSSEALAERIGVSSGYLRRLFKQTFGVSIQDYNQSRRLLLARQLLDNSHLSMTDIAQAAGFRSLRRFNSAFLDAYRSAPSHFRRSARSSPMADHFRFDLCYRPPYDWDGWLDFMSDRCIPGVERVSNGCYSRTIRLPSCAGYQPMAETKDEEVKAGWISVEHQPQRDRFIITASLNLLPHLGWLKRCLDRCLDLSQDPDTIDSEYRHLQDWQKGTRLPGCFDPFEACVRAINGQQISVSAAQRKLELIVQHFGTDCRSDDQTAECSLAPKKSGELNRLFPTPERLAQLQTPDLAALGIIRQRANAMIAAAKLFTGDSLPAEFPAECLEQLLCIPGIGSWTAGYVAIRGLGMTDIYLDGDRALQNAAQRLQERAPDFRSFRDNPEAGSPWRSYLTIYLWQQQAAQVNDKQQVTSQSPFKSQSPIKRRFPNAEDSPGTDQARLPETL